MNSNISFGWSRFFWFDYSTRCLSNNTGTKSNSKVKTNNNDGNELSLTKCDRNITWMWTKFDIYRTSLINRSTIQTLMKKKIIRFRRLTIIDLLSNHEYISSEHFVRVLNKLILSSEVKCLFSKDKCVKRGNSYLTEIIFKEKTFICFSSNLDQLDWSDFSIFPIDPPVN